MSEKITKSPPKPHRSEVELPEWEGYRRRLLTRAAFDQRDPDPNRDYGISGAYFVFCLIGKDRAITWELCSDCFLPETKKRLRDEGHPWMGPTAGPVDFHYREPQYEGMRSSDDCTLLDGTCYGNTGFLLGDDVYRAFAYGGIDGVFGKLRELLEAP